MLLTQDDIDEFKESNHFAWMGTRIITPECISFTDYMYGNLWTIKREVSDDVVVLVLRRKKPGGKRFVRMREDFLISGLLIAAEIAMWDDAMVETPDLSRISLPFILDAPKRLDIEEVALPFLLMAVPIKLRQDGT